MLMKKMFLVFVLGLVLVLPFTSAGFVDWVNKITGEATSQPVELNITVGAGSSPQIAFVYNDTMTDISSGPNEAPVATDVTLKFMVYDPDGYSNLDDASAGVSFSKSGEDTRQNLSCVRVDGESSGDYANYTCLVKMWWWDGTGTWDISVSINDINDNSASDNSADFQMGATLGFVSSPSALTWAQISPGAENQEANENMLFNNTGNVDRNIEVNSTNLRGESDNTKVLWAGNFSANTVAGCEGTSMILGSYAQVGGASLPSGNFTIADGTGQEEIYFCLETAGAELTQQSYSTNQEGAWTVRIA